MGSHPGRDAALLAVLCCSFGPLPGAGAAQAARASRPAPELVFGEVQDHDGKAWSGAHVTLLSRPFPRSEEVGVPDLIETDSDDGGRFRATLLAGRRYSVWAVAPSADREYRITQVEEDVCPGLPVMLREEKLPRIRMRLELGGREPWERKGPVRVQVVSGTGNVHVVPLELDATGAAILPPLPGASCHVEVRDQDGMPLIVSRLNLTGRSAAEVESIGIPPPVPVLIQVVAAATGAGVPGANVFLRRRASLYLLGSTDAKGSCTQKLPGGFSAGTLRPFDLELQIEAPGSTALRWPGSDGRPDSGIRDVENLTFKVAPGCTLAGTVVPQAGPAAGRIPLILCSAASRGGPTVRWTEADGTFAISGLPERRDFSLWTVWTDAGNAGGLAGATFSPPSLVLLASRNPPGNEKIELGALRLGDFRPVDLQVVLADGSPADRPALAISGATLGMGPVPLVADRQGRLRLMLRGGDTVLIGARYGDEAGVRELRVPGGREPRPWTLPLQRLLFVAGRVEDAEKKPLRGIQAALNWSPRGAMDEPTRLRWDLFYRAGPRGAMHTTVTDDEGRFRLAVPLANEKYAVHLSGWAGSIRLLTTEREVEVEDDPVTDLRIGMGAHVEKATNEKK